MLLWLYVDFSVSQKLYLCVYKLYRQNILCMEKLRIKCLLLALVAFATAGARRVAVNVATPGTLQQEFTKAAKGKASDLKITGTLDARDWKFLRRLMDASGNGLARLDVSGVRFRPGDEPYLSGSLKIEKSGAFPRMALSECRVGEVVMPDSAADVSERAFENSTVRRVVLAENSLLERESFANCPELQEVVFPKNTLMIKQAFTDCPKLGRIEIHNVGFVAAGGAVRNCDALREIVIDGNIMHIDGSKTFNSLKSLERVVFGGYVFSSGGGNNWMTDCPNLREIVFAKDVVSTAFAETPGCPLFKGYSVKGAVYSSNNKKILPQADLTDKSREAYYKKSAVRMYKEMRPFLSYNWKQTGHDGFIKVAYGDALNTVCNLAARFNVGGMGTSSDVKTALVALQEEFDRNWVSPMEVETDSNYMWLWSNSDFKQMVEKAKEAVDYLGLLRKFPAYERTGQTQPPFTYEHDTPLLREIRDSLKLDSVAGNGDEISRIKNVMYWVHDQIHHDGSSSWPTCDFNALALYRLCQRENRPLNCRFLAMVLTDCYLALGMPARFLTCQPANSQDSDCHVITIVWSRDLGKWIWMDPSFAAYITDENGQLLHPGEVRERLVKGLPLNLNEDANWNHENKQTKEYYLETYMAKNLFYLSCHNDNRPNVESDRKTNLSVTLLPVGSDCYFSSATMTSDDAYFWQAPASE